jgi:hypothetical protein
MGLNDNTKINLLERVTSSDLNEMQSLSGRLMSEAIRGLGRKFIAGGIPSELSTFGVASGLKISTSGVNVVVGTGVLVQSGMPNDPPDVPIPETFDSLTARYGLHLASTSLPVPARGVDTYWLVQGRVERDDTLTATRDIWDPGTLTFVPTAGQLKRQESKVVVELKEGTTTTIPAPDTGYSRIGAVLLLTGAGSILTNNTFQLVAQFNELSSEASDDGACNRTSFRHRSNFQINEISTGSEFNFAAEVNGFKLWAKTNNTTNDTSLRSTPFIDTNHTAQLATTDLWWYIYLAAPDDYIPENLYTDGSTMDVEHRGLIICSRTRPDINGCNSASLGVPLPLGGTIAAGKAAFVGVFKSNGAGTTGIDFIDVSAGGRGRVEKQQFRSATGFVMNDGNSFLAGTYNLAVLGAGGTEDVPYGVQLSCWISTVVASGIDITPPPYALMCEFGMTNDAGTNLERVLLPLDEFANARFDLWPEEDSLSMDLVATKIDQTGTPDATATTTTFWAGLLGISF